MKLQALSTAMLHTKRAPLSQARHQLIGWAGTKDGSARASRMRRRRGRRWRGCRIGRASALRGGSANGTLNLRLVEGSARVEVAALRD